MAEEWKEGIPSAYYLENDKPGRVYRATKKGPPMQVKECSEWDYGGQIVIEFEDGVKAAAKEVFGEDVDPTVRFVFHPSDARFLTVSLIDALESGGDVVAKKLKNALVDFWEEERKKRDEDKDFT